MLTVVVTVKMPMPEFESASKNFVAELARLNGSAGGLPLTILVQVP